MQYCRIAVFGLAFLIATITQLQAAFTRNFHYDMKDDLPRWFMWVLVVTGRLPLPCHFHSTLYNKSQTDLYTASCACDGATTVSALKQFVQLPFCHCSASFLFVSLLKQFIILQLSAVSFLFAAASIADLPLRCICDQSCFC